MNGRNRGQKRPQKPLQKYASRLSAAQRDKMIPGGPVTKERLQKGNIVTEIVAENTSGEVLIARQKRVTPISRLRESGLIGEEETRAANLFTTDYTAAYVACQSVLAKLHVDHSGGSESLIQAQLRRAKHGLRFYRALGYLGDDLREAALEGIAYTLIDSHAGGVFCNLGRRDLPTCPRSEWAGAGKQLLILAARRLAEFYGYRKATITTWLDIPPSKQRRS